MPTFEIGVEFEVFCQRCGTELCLVSTFGATDGGRLPYVSVEPCQACEEKARDEAYEQGLSESGSQE